MTYEHPNIFDALTDSLAGHTLYPRLFREHLQMLRLAPNEHVLEIGCGGGNMTRLICNTLGPKGTVTSIDVNEYWLSRARRRVVDDRVTFILGDATTVELPPVPYSLALFHYMLHDVPYHERSPLVKRVAGLLGKGARAFVCEPTKESHGMPPGEVDALFAQAGMTRLDQAKGSSFIMGSFYRALYGNT
ncbi:MAG: methyltransferase domain-containing protein [Candidatus Methanofastidiosa archaeon]|nr:methyltransferase domain-containing protein [Candidatus Methanofastidiosa archaeon]